MLTIIGMASKEEMLNADIDDLVQRYRATESPVDRCINFSMLFYSIGLQSIDGVKAVNLDELISCLGNPDGMAGTVRDGRVEYLGYFDPDHTSGEMDAVYRMYFYDGLIVGVGGDPLDEELSKWNYDFFTVGPIYSTEAYHFRQEQLREFTSQIVVSTKMEKQTFSRKIKPSANHRGFFYKSCIARLMEWGSRRRLYQTRTLSQCEPRSVGNTPACWLNLALFMGFRIVMLYGPQKECSWEVKPVFGPILALLYGPQQGSWEIP